MNEQLPSRNVKKTPGYKDTLKFHGEREAKVKKAVFEYIQNKQVEIVSADQVYYDKKHQSLTVFAAYIKDVLESTKNKDFPIFTVENYVLVLRELNAEQQEAKAPKSPNFHSKAFTEQQILDFITSDKLNFVKSHEQAEEFLKHILFKVADSASLVQVVARKHHEVKDASGQIFKFETEIKLPGTKTLREYEETLKSIKVRTASLDKQETYWDIYSRSKAIVCASSVYNPYKELYWYDEYKHYYINSYNEPDWKKQPNNFYLMDRHKNNPITLNTLSDLLRSFLSHLFPDKATLREVVKWCAFSNTEKLQTYLTLIGPQGIGKNVLVEVFLKYYHGDENLNKPKKIDTQFNNMNAKSTLLYFDEKVIINLEQYNEMKSLVNSSLAYEEKCKPIYMSQNFANIVWSCNTKDTMSGMSRDDRRFKIVPITSTRLLGAPILDITGKKIGIFTNSVIANLSNSEEFKKEFVLLMLSMRDHVEMNNEGKDDINTVSENDARDAILSESRSLHFTEIIDVLKNIYNDYNEVTGRFGKEPTGREEKDALGLIYKDYIPLSDLKIAVDGAYTYRVPFSVIRKVIEIRSSKQNSMSFRTFNRHLENMPPKTMRGYIRKGQERDIEIKLDDDLDKEFNDNLKPILLNIGKLKIAKQPVKEDDSNKNPFGGD